MTMRTMTPHGLCLDSCEWQLQWCAWVSVRLSSLGCCGRASNKRFSSEVEWMDYWWASSSCLSLAQPLSLTTYRAGPVRPVSSSVGLSTGTHVAPFLASPWQPWHVVTLCAEEGAEEIQTHKDNYNALSAALELLESIVVVHADDFNVKDKVAGQQQ